MSSLPAHVHPAHASHRFARVSAVVLAALLAAVPLMVASPAQAAEIPGAISDVTVESSSGSSPIGRYEGIDVGAQWSVPDNSLPGDTFSLVLPAELRGLTSAFPLQDDDGATFGSCEVAATRVLCTLSDLVTSRPLDVGGSLFFSGQFTDQIVSGQPNDLLFDTGLAVETVTVDVAAVTPYAGNGFRKSGRVEADGSVTWFVDLPQSATGLEEDLTNVVITDELDPALAFVGPERVRLTRATTLNSSGSGPLYTEVVDRSTYSVAISGQTAVVTIPVLTAGFYYRLVIDTVPVAGGSDSYTNSATLSAAELGAVESTVSTVEFAAGGNGGGVAPTTPVVTPVTPGEGSGVGGVVVPGVSPVVAPGSTPADSADRSRAELAATGVSTEGTIGFAGLALLFTVAGAVMVTARRIKRAR